jgi:hypothetical protein
MASEFSTTSMIHTIFARKVEGEAARLAAVAAMHFSITGENPAPLYISFACPFTVLHVSDNTKNQSTMGRYRKNLVPMKRYKRN